MKHLKVCKFEPLAGQTPEPVTIIIDSELPNFNKLFADYKGQEWFDQANQWYQDEAESIVDALYKALPQGTFDRLGVEFMRRKVSFYRGKTNG